MKKAKKTVIPGHAALFAAVVVLLLVVVPGAHADSWTATGSMLDARTGHAMARLTDGRVLVVGGYNASAVLASAEVYDPSTGKFAFTGSMSTQRWRATATALNNTSYVLIAGGSNAAGQHLSSAEVYDSTTGAFSLTGSMSTARRGHSATILGNGKVLIAGGFNGSFISAAEVYDPSTGAFSPTGSMTAARRAHTATMLPNGKVLIIGGENVTGYLSSAELYDPATGKFSATGSMGFSRSLHSATMLPNGKVLIVGGYNGGYLFAAELYDPISGTFIPTGSMGTARREHGANLLQNGKVLINGGYNGGYPSSVELYDPCTGTFSATVPLISARTWHASAVLYGGKVLVTGGENSTGYLSSAELYAIDSGPISVEEHPVTATARWETMPRLGNDGVSDLVVFPRGDMLPNDAFGKGDIWFQRLDSDGVPSGVPVQVTSGPRDNGLGDVSGDYIVFTSWDSTASTSGRIMVYQISTAALYEIGSATVILESRISGSKVVWREGGPNATQVMLYDLSWLGTTRGPDIIAGPIPPTLDVDIGDRFAVWDEKTSGQQDIVAYDLTAGVRINVTETPSSIEDPP